MMIDKYYKSFLVIVLENTKIIMHLILIIMLILLIFHKIHQIIRF